MSAKSIIRHHAGLRAQLLANASPTFSLALFDLVYTLLLHPIPIVCLRAKGIDGHLSGKTTKNCRAVQAFVLCGINRNLALRATRALPFESLEFFSAQGDWINFD